MNMSGKIVNKLSEIQLPVRECQAGFRMMLGGFMGIGSAQSLMEYLALRDLPPLDLITSDAAFPGKGAGALGSALYC